MTRTLDAVGDPALREALLFARARPAPFTADDLAGRLDLHRNVARARLDRLVEAGLLDVSFARRSGRSGPGAGRPAKVYRVRPELSAIEFPARHHDLLVGALADSLPERGRAAALARAGGLFGRGLARAAGLRPAGDAERGLAGVCRALGRLGFQASLTEVGPGRAVIETSTCPLRPVVAARPDAAAIDRGMWAALVECGVSGLTAERVTCETAGCADGSAPCSVVLGLQEASDSGATVSR